jgi:hypothetical protein
MLPFFKWLTRTSSLLQAIQKLVVRMSVGGYLTNPTAFTYVLAVAVREHLNCFRTWSSEASAY